MSHPIHPDDPRLTAYALGELTEPERSDIERQLADNAECLAYVAELRELAGQITGSLAQEPAVDLTPAQHTEIEVAAAAGLPSQDPTPAPRPNLSPRPTQQPTRMARHVMSIYVSGGFAVMVAIVFSNFFFPSSPNTTFNSVATKLGGGGGGSNSRYGEELAAGHARPSDDQQWEADAGSVADTVLHARLDTSFPKQSNSDNLEISSKVRIEGPQTTPADSPSVPTGSTKPFSNRSQKMAIRLPAPGPAQESNKNLKAWKEAEAAAAKANRVSVGQIRNYAPIAQADKPGKPQDSKPQELAVADHERMIRDQKERERQLKIAKDPSAQETPPTAGEAYAAIADNPFLGVVENPLSTFSIDVDTASYANVRRFLMQGQLPPPAAVRLEELLNYFSYDYPQPQGDVPFSVNMEVAQCPWSPAHHLLRVGLKGKEVQRTQRPVSNLVFLLDVSGSMQDPNKLPLVKAGMQMLVDNLSENDRVAIVVYAGASGLVLDSTTADKKQAILSAIENLQAGGSTNGGAGIELAYSLAAKNFIKGGTNRVILCTDGDFNVGVTSPEELVRMVTEKAKAGTFLTVLGFGMGNLKDSMLEQLADRGNGNYAYIDSLQEAKKVLVDQLSGTLVTIAKDVKIQIEFNPAHIVSYRLLGYENRLLAAEDFHDDTKDAGEVGAGHTVTALYELVPTGTATIRRVDPLKYQKNPAAPEAPAADPAYSKELLTLKLRYKQPEADASRLLEFPVANRIGKFAQASPDFAWAASVASFGMILRHSPHRGESTLPAVLEMAEVAKGADPTGYRAEFIQLVQQAQSLGAK